MKAAAAVAANASLFGDLAAGVIRVQKRSDAWQ
jgi:hypothetical protein